VAKSFRPPLPERNPDYPTKIALSLKLLNEFNKGFSFIRIKAIIADNLYSSKEFFDGATKLTGQPQVISQIKKTQLINVNGKFTPVGDFFASYSGKTEEVTLRHTPKKITYRSAKFKIKSHDKRLYVIAIKHEDEEEYRYLVANDTTWRDIDIIKTYAFRWLVEVFIQDWKSYEGWDQLAMQRGIDGSEHGVIISLLSDHALHFHQDQLALYQNKEPAATVGSLREKVMMESLLAFIKNIVAEVERRISQKSDQAVIFEGDPAWKLTLAGSVASIMCNKYSKPVFIFKKMDKESCGSVRSPKGTNSVDAMKTCSDLLLTFGGHANASGFRAKNENLGTFESRLNEFFNPLGESKK
jgi:hypothetical protein